MFEQLGNSARAYYDLLLYIRAMNLSEQDKMIIYGNIWKIYIMMLEKENKTIFQDGMSSLYVIYVKADDKNLRNKI